MANTLNVGNGNWATKENSLLGYNSENGNYKPLPFDFTRASNATFVNKSGLIETAANGVPRIDFLGNTSGALLLEPQRTNSLLQSNQFDTTWTLSSSINLTSEKSGIGGEVNAWLLKKTDSSSRYINQTITLSSQTYSYSVFAKKESGNWLYVRLADSGGSLASASYFDLENGVVGSTSADSISIKNYNDGWYRCEISFTHSVGNVRMYPAVGDGVPSGGSGLEGIYIYGAQLEQGSYSTSLINTQGSAVTRSADVCNNGGNDQVINSTEGVLYYEVSAQDNSITTSILSISNGSNANSLYSGFSSSSNTIQAQLVVGGVAQTNMNYVVSDRTKFNKVAILYQNNNHKMYVNGVEAVVDTSGSVPSANTFDRLNFDLGQGSFDFYGNVKDVRVYNTALTDQELIALTS